MGLLGRLLRLFLYKNGVAFEEVKFVPHLLSLLNLEIHPISSIILS